MDDCLIFMLVGIPGKAREWSMEFAFKSLTTMAFPGAFPEILATLKIRLT